MERFDKVSLKYHETRTALDMIRREIESSLVKNPGEKDISKEKASFIIKDRDIFGKSTSSIELTAFSFKGNNPNIISYFVESKDGRLRLLKTERPLLKPFKEYTVEIIEDIEGFSVETLFNKKWVKTWDTANTGTLPELVRISIEFEDNGKIVKLTEYARPKVGRQL
jgi:hypothetical protein